MAGSGEDVVNTREADKLKSKFEQRIELACRWDVVRCALVMSAIVGTVLVAINHGYCVCKGMFGYVCLGQSMLTYLVPYCVSTISSVLAIEKGVK